MFLLKVGIPDYLYLFLLLTNATGNLDLLDMDDPLVKLTSYVSVLTSKRNNNDLVWSGFYIDDSGLGEMTTAALPVFTFNTTGSMKGELVGVVGHDIPLSQFQSRGVSYAEVLGTVTNRISTCNMKPLGTCPLQVRHRNMSTSTVEALVPVCKSLQQTAAVVASFLRYAISNILQNKS